ISDRRIDEQNATVTWSDSDRGFFEEIGVTAEYRGHERPSTALRNRKRIEFVPVRHQCSYRPEYLQLVGKVPVGSGSDERWADECASLRVGIDKVPRIGLIDDLRIGCQFPNSIFNRQPLLHIDEWPHHDARVGGITHDELL